MRILLLSASYPPVLGGLQVAVHSLARGLVRREHDVIVVTNLHPRSLPPGETIDDVPVRRWSFLKPELEYLRSRRDLFAASCYYYPATLLKLSKLIRSFRPDVVNIHFPDRQVPFLLRCHRHFRFPLVVSLHGDEIARWGPHGAGAGGRTFSRSPLSSILSHANAVTACSTHLLDMAVNLQPSVAKKGCVIHHGVDSELLRSNNPYPHPRPYALAYGRLTYAKGFDLLVRAFAQVAERHTDMDLIIAGEGTERQELASLCGELGISERVKFVGRKATLELAQLLSGCRLVIVPSRRESFGLAALEAATVGKPVLATAVGGLPELVRGPAGYLVEPTVAGLVEGLSAFLENRWAWTSAAVLNTAVRAWSDVTSDFLGIYSRLTSVGASGDHAACLSAESCESAR